MYSFLVSSLPIALCLSALYLPAASATPLNKLQKRFFDLDGNGIPDECGAVNAQGVVKCELPNGAWTALATSTYSAGMLYAKSTPTPAKVAAPAQVTASLPEPSTFQADNGTKWTIEYVGNLQFTGSSALATLGGDKCRSSSLGGKVIWNCGDMECGSDPNTCGFSMGPAFYGTSNVMDVDVTGITNVGDNTFLTPFVDDAKLASGNSWGMDTSNVAAINDTHGVAYAWQIQRGNTVINEGNAVASITLGDSKPIATRVGPLLTGPSAIQLGLVAILRVDNYVYVYSSGGPTNLIVGRVTASDDVFDASKYSFLETDGKTWSTPASGIPDASSTTYGMTTANTSGQFGCNVYGSVFYSAYLQKYVIICTADESFTNMYVSATPEGPWSAEYQLLKGWGPGYGSMAHPEFSTDGQQSFYFSQGPDGPMNMFKVSFKF